METKLHGVKTDIPRANMWSDEQMCCDCCKVPILDYHRHCTMCLYDLCLACSRNLRQLSVSGTTGESAEGQVVGRSQDEATLTEQTTEAVVGDEHLAHSTNKSMLDLSHLFMDWKANCDGSIPCPPKESGGCGCPSLSLRRIFKMNWVAKLVKNAEELVGACKVYDADCFQTCLSFVGSTPDSQPNGLSDSKHLRFSNIEARNDNFLYCPLSQDIKHEGIFHFQKHWGRGEPTVVKHVFDSALTSMWDPINIWMELSESTDEITKDDKRTVKAIDCLDWSEVDIELGQFIKGYSEGRIHENGLPEMLKLKDWPPPSALEEFLLYQRPEFISKLPLLEYIHSKWGVLNLFAKLPYDSLQIDTGPKLCIAYGTSEELGRGDSVTNLQIKMGDVVYLLMHTSEVKFQGWQRVKIEKLQRDFIESDSKESPGDAHMVEQQIILDEGVKSPDLAPSEPIKQNGFNLELNVKDDDIMEEQMCNDVETTSNEEKQQESSHSDEEIENDVPTKAHVGALWDVFRRQDVPKLKEYLRVHWTEFSNVCSAPGNSVMHPIFNQAIFLNKDHKRKLKDEFDIEPWTIEQHVGEAVFIPAGCPFQVRNLQSSVQLGVDFLSPESLGESIRLAQEIRSLSNNHEAKLQMLEVGKMALYAASSAIREIQKLTLDPGVSAELGFEDKNLTALISENIERLSKPRRISCI